MYCKKCGNELQEGINFCNKCGTKVGEYSNTNERNEEKQHNKKHWIKNTILAQKCRENEKTRKLVASVVVIIVVLLFISIIVGYGNLDVANTQLSGAKGINDLKSMTYWKDKVFLYKCQMIGSFIGAILVLHYGKKIIEKD